MTEFISSRENPLFKELRALQAAGSKGQKARLSFGHTLLEGIHLIQTWCADPALEVLITSELGIENHEIDALIRLHLDACPGTRVIYLEANLWGELSELVNGPQIAGLLSLPSAGSVGTLNGDVVVLDRIQDAGNMGAILRTAAAAGFIQIVALSGCAHVWSGKVLRAGMGAHRGLNLYEGWSNQQALSAITAPLFLATANSDACLFDLGSKLQQPVAWVLGSEGQGVSEALLAQGNPVSIPMASQVESLNVATAAAICLFETVRVRR